MTGTALAALIRYKTNTNSTTFTDANMLVLVNLFKNEISSLITERNQNFFAVPAKDDLVADQREYPFTSDFLNNLLKVECMFVSGDAYIPLYSIKDYRLSETESEIVARYANVEGSCAYYLRRRSVWILSGTISAVTNGIRIWYVQQPVDLSNLTGSTDLSIDPSTTTAGFPKQFHELLARRVSIEYKGSRPKPIPLNDMEKNYERDLERQLDAIAHMDLSGEIIGENETSQNLFNDGFDL